MGSPTKILGDTTSSNGELKSEMNGIQGAAIAPASECSGNIDLLEDTYILGIKESVGTLLMACHCQIQEHLSANLNRT